MTRIDAEPPGEYPAVEFLDIPPMDASLATPPVQPASWPSSFIEDIVERLDGDVDQLRSLIAALESGSPEPAA
jgi:hypothetical protein